MRRRAFALVPLLALLGSGSAVAQQRVTPPGDHLGHPVGEDFRLVDWNQLSSYFKRLAEESPRVLVETVGETTEGRDFLLAVVSSEENLARLDEIKEEARRIADPRGLEEAAREALLREGKVVLFVSCAMHSTETAAPQLAMELAHELATSDEEPWASARERLVVLIAPTLNPDGLDHVVSWWRETRGTPHEGAGLTKLYQYYTGHDNNRDWFALTQAETRIVTQLLYSEWFPQVYWDVHQQGGRRERFFIPPYRDPLDPNLDPSVIAGIDALSSRALLDMTREGLTGVATGVTYDMWWNGGNRSVPVRHNILGILTEAASVNYAAPVFLPRAELEPPRGLPSYAPSNQFPAPWPGGWWRIRDIIDYELAFGRSILGSLAREPRTWLSNALEAAERAVDEGRDAAPRAWLVPADNRDRGAVKRLVDTLLLGGVEVYAAEAAFQADGRGWPAGTLVIPRDQPYGAHVKDLFEVQRYPEGSPPYDVSGWTLPVLFGVRRAEVMEPFDAELVRVTRADAALPDGLGGGRGWDSRDSDAWKQVVAALGRGEVLRFRTSGDEAGRFLPAEGPAGEGDVTVAGLPRLGVYAPWWGSKDEGWLRWVLDTWGVPYTRVRNEMIRAGDLHAFLDVLILPSIDKDDLDGGRAPGTVPERFTRGLEPEGLVAIEEFVRGGGTLVALDDAAGWAADVFHLPLEDVTRPPEPVEPAFSCPGSVLRALPVEHPLTAGLPPSLALFFSRSRAWRVVEPAPPANERAATDERELDVLLRYAPTGVLLSGWIRAPEAIADRAAWVRVRHGQGRLHLFAFRPHYRGWSQQAFQLLFRSVLVDR